MTEPAALMAELRARLTGPGGEFELAEQDVRGTRLPVFVHRRAALRDWLSRLGAYGEREYLVQGERRLTYRGHLDAVAALADVLAREYGVQAGRPRRDPGRELARLGGRLLGRVALGAVAVAGNAWWTAREAAYSLERVRPRVVIADAKRAALLAGVGAPVLDVADVPALVAARGPVALPHVRRRRRTTPR